MSFLRPLSGLAGLLLLLMGSLSGCNTPTDLYLGHRNNLYADRYIALLHGQNVPPPLLYTTPQVVPGHNVSAQSIKEREYPNATVVGISSFIISYSPNGDPVELAQKLGADVVILTRTYLDTQQRPEVVRVELTDTWKDNKGNTIRGKREVLAPDIKEVDIHRYEAMFLRTSQAEVSETQQATLARD